MSTLRVRGPDATPSCHRREFLAAASAAALAPAGLSAQLVAAPAAEKKVAAIVTTYHRYSHADNIVTRFMEGFSIIGKSYPPPCRVASLFIEQVTDHDIGQPLARQWKVRLSKTIADALTLGGDSLAVDGVLIVAEQGDYPINERGQRLYPRRRFFENVVQVFRDSKRSVPVFIDKHLAYTWKHAKWMYDQSRELGFPMMAGSSVPVAARQPDLQPAAGVEWERALSVGYGHFEVYGFHTLEALQVMTERRQGGETGVKAVQCLEGPAAWEGAAAGKWDRELLDAALRTVPPGASAGHLTPPPKGEKKSVQEVDRNALAYLIEYRDGLRATAYMSQGYAREFAFAGREKGKREPAACWYQLPKPQRDHFSHLVRHVGTLMATGKPAYPVERTLLTGGMLDFVLESRAKGGQRVETPELEIRYNA